MPPVFEGKARQQAADMMKVNSRYVSVIGPIE